MGMLRERLSVAEHTTAFEARLADFLARRCSASSITLADMKDIVWNEYDSNLLSRVAFALAEQNPRAKFEDVLQIMSDAWNNFPHQRLNGLAPRDMVERITADESFTFDARPDFYTLFADCFPKMVRVVKQGDHEWSWEYPAPFHTWRTEFAAMRGENETWADDGGDKSDIENVEQELLRKMNILAAKACIDEDPLRFDAALVLARDAFKEGEARLAKSVLEAAIHEGRNMLPQEFSLGTDHLPWGFVDNRPFLLLLGEYVTLVEAIDGTQKAIPLYEELIALNPNDNQGIRAFLATAYIATNRLEEVLTLDKKYPGDAMVELSAGTLLALYKLGRRDAARARIKATKKHLAHVFREIIKTEHPQPKLIPGRIRVGGDDEAWLYWQNQGTFWMATPGAREFLKEHTSG